MKIAKYTAIFLILSFTLSAFARPSHHNRHQRKKRFLKDRYSLCNGAKINEYSYLNVYQAIKYRFKKYIKDSDQDLAPIELWKGFLAKESKGHDNYKCARNKFKATNFLLYFSQLTDFFDREDYIELPFFKLRDQLYVEWVPYKDQKIIDDNTKKEVLPLSEINLKPKGHKVLRFMTKIVNRVPRGKSKEDQAIRDVAELIQGKSVFNSIFTEYAREYFFSKKLLSQARCFLNGLDNGNGKSILDIGSDCTDNRKEFLILLGVFSSQIDFMARDFKATIYKYSTDEDYATFRDILSTTSLIYFKLKTYGEEFGVESLYPDNFVEQMVSVKPYHFYSIAFIASYLTEKGYDEETVLAASTYFAKKYKVGVKYAGYVYNFLLGSSLKGGSVGDFDQILIEQGLGAQFGVEVLN